MEERLLKKLDKRFKKIEEIKVPLKLIMDEWKLYNTKGGREADIFTEYEHAKLELEGAHEFPDKWKGKGSYDHILSHIKVVEEKLGNGD